MGRSSFFAVAALVLVACDPPGSGSSGSGSCVSDCDVRAIVEGGQVNAHGIAVAKDSVYWGTEPQGGNPNLLRRVANTGGQVSDVTTDTGRFELASNGDAIFFVKARDLVRLDAGTATPVVLVPKLSGSSVRGLAANRTHVYWTDGSDINRVAVTGGAVEKIYSAPIITHIAIDETNVYYSEGINNTLQAVAIDAPSPKTPRTLAKQADEMRFAIWNGTAYFGSQRDRTIKSVPVTGGTPTQLAEAEQGPLSFAADGTGIYFGTQGGLSRLPLGGGVPVHVGENDPKAHMVLDITLDDAYVYWVDYSFQAVFRAGK
jgi:hypothetical protein